VSRSGLGTERSQQAREHSRGFVCLPSEVFSDVSWHDRIETMTSRYHMTSSDVARLAERVAPNELVLFCFTYPIAKMYKD
jgi:hypothetical protein